MTSWWTRWLKQGSPKPDAADDFFDERLESPADNDIDDEDNPDVARTMRMQDASLHAGFDFALARLIPKAPMLDWINSRRAAEGDAPLSSAHALAQSQVYAVPILMNHEEIRRWLRAKHWRLTWEYELSQIDPHESTWPKRTLPAFDNWVDVEILDMPTDLQRFAVLCKQKQ